MAVPRLVGRGEHRGTDDMPLQRYEHRRQIHTDTIFRDHVLALLQQRIDVGAAAAIALAAWPQVLMP